MKNNMAKDSSGFEANSEEKVMDRDLRITGSLRGQSGNTEAPKGFEVSNPWKVGGQQPTYS